MKYNNKNKLIFLFIIIFKIQIIAQNQSSISGFIRDNDTGEPLGYTNIFIKDSNIGAVSTSDGYYVLTQIPSGNLELVASIIGYEMTTKKILISNQEKKRLDFRLKPKVIEGESIDVFGEIQKMRDLVEPSRISLDLRTLETAPAFVESDLFRTVQMLPGVQTLNDFSSALYVRGSTPDQNLIMMDGITIYNPYHFGGIFSTFNTDAIAEADFHAGGFPAKFGGRMGSILDIINKEGNTEKFQGVANISALSSKVLLEGPLPSSIVKGSWMIAGRRTYFDRVFNYFINRSLEASDSEFKFPYYFYDYQIKINIDFSQDHRLTYSSFYGEDVLELNTNDKKEYYDIESDYYESRQDNFVIKWPWGNKIQSLTWRWLISPKFIAKTVFANSYYRFTFNTSFESFGSWTSGQYLFGDYRDYFSFNFYDSIDDNTIATEFSWHGSTKHKLSSGFQIKNVKYNLGMDIEYSTLDTSFFWNPLKMKDMTQESSIFFQDKWNYSSKILFQLGTRLSHYSLHKKIYIDPRFGMKYLISTNLSLKLAVGRYHQFLTIANPEDETFRIVDFWFGLQEDNKAMFSDHIILGSEFLSPKNWLFRIESYYKHFENLITLQQGEIIRTNTNDESDNQTTFSPFNDFYDTKGFAYGIELLFKKTSGNVRGWIGYTFANTKRYIEKHGWFNPKFDRRHTLNIVGDISVPIIKKTYISIAIQSSSGQPYTPPLGTYEEWTTSNSAYYTNWSNTEQYIVGKKNSKKLPSYFRLDLGLKQKKSIFGKSYERFIQVINATNHLNPLTYQYRTKINQLTQESIGLERAAIPMFPLIITFGWRIEF